MVRGKSAYIVDDDNLIRSALKHMLTEEGMIVRGEAENTRTLTESLKTNSYDLLILDIYLPGGETGLDFLKKLRAIRPHQKVLMITSEPTEDHVKASIALGVSGFIVKPFNLGKIRETLEKCFP